MSEEVRETDPLTGGQKGSKLARFSLIPTDWLWALAEHYGRGSLKYSDRNWEKGYKWSLSYDALNRHLNAWWGRDEIDEETGSSHLLAVAWHAASLWWWREHGKGTDDRPPLSPAPEWIWRDYQGEVLVGVDGSGIAEWQTGPAPTRRLRRYLRKKYQ